MYYEQIHSEKVSIFKQTYKASREWNENDLFGWVDGFIECVQGRI